MTLTAILHFLLRNDRAVYVSELEIDRRRKFRAGHNPGVSVEARKETARLVGIVQL